MIDRRSGETSGAAALPPGARSSPTVCPLELSTSARSRLPSTTRGVITTESGSGWMERGSGSSEGPVGDGLGLDDGELLVGDTADDGVGGDEEAVLPAAEPLPPRVSANAVAEIATTATATIVAMMIRLRLRWSGAVGPSGPGAPPGPGPPGPGPPGPGPVGP